MDAGNALPPRGAERKDLCASVVLAGFFNNLAREH